MGLTPSSPALDWVERGEDALLLRVDRQVYSDDAIFRACYVFTDRCYLLLNHDGADHLTVRFRRRQAGADLDSIVGEFVNELINQRVRVTLARETEGIRRLIVAQAFAGADTSEQ